MGWHICIHTHIYYLTTYAHREYTVCIRRKNKASLSVSLGSPTSLTRHSKMGSAEQKLWTVAHLPSLQQQVMQYSYTGLCTRIWLTSNFSNSFYRVLGRGALTNTDKRRKDLLCPTTSNAIMFLKPEGGAAVDRPVLQGAVRAGVA